VVEADCGGIGPGYPGSQGITSRKLLRPKAKRLAASHARESLGLNERKACLLVNVSASVYRARLLNRLQANSTTSLYSVAMSSVSSV
jgi:hypothetical protein